MFSDPTKAMDSREIALRAGKTHTDVCRDIETGLGQLPGGVRQFSRVYRSTRDGKLYRHYVLPFREYVILVTGPGYDTRILAAILDRIFDLEQPKYDDPQVKRFRRWITHDVLPSIRRTGGYTLPELRPPQTYAEALQAAADRQRQIDAANGGSKPYVPRTPAEAAEIARLQRELVQHSCFRPGQPGHSILQKNDPTA